MSRRVARTAMGLCLLSLEIVMEYLLTKYQAYQDSHIIERKCKLKPGLCVSSHTIVSIPISKFIAKLKN